MIEVSKNNTIDLISTSSWLRCIYFSGWISSWGFCTRLSVSSVCTFSLTTESNYLTRWSTSMIWTNAIRDTGYCAFTPPGHHSANEWPPFSPISVENLAVRDSNLEKVSAVRHNFLYNLVYTGGGRIGTRKIWHLVPFQPVLLNIEWSANQKNLVPIRPPPV